MDQASKKNTAVDLSKFDINLLKRQLNDNTTLYINKEDLADHRLKDLYNKYLKTDCEKFLKNIDYDKDSYYKYLRTDYKKFLEDVDYGKQ